MADKRRTPQETKDVGIARLIKSYEKNTNSVCPTSEKQKFEQMYTKEILPKVYDKDRK